MKDWIIVFCCAFSLVAKAQSDSLNFHNTHLYTFQEKQYKIAKRSMIVLGAYATSNLFVGLVGRSQSTGSNLYFHEMNFGFNLVNFALSGVGLLSLERPSRSVTLSQLVRKQYKLEKIYLLNAGLDVAYVFGGLALINYGKRMDVKLPERALGYGKSIVLQGAFYYFMMSYCIICIIKIREQFGIVQIIFRQV